MAPGFLCWRSGELGRTSIVAVLQGARERKKALDVGVSAQVYLNATGNEPGGCTCNSVNQ